METHILLVAHLRTQHLLNNIFGFLGGRGIINMFVSSADKTNFAFWKVNGRPVKIIWMHELKVAAFHVPYICRSDNYYFVNNFYYFSSSISRNCFVWDRYDLNHEYVILLMPQEFCLGSKLLRPTIWHVFIGSKNIIIEFMPLLGGKKGVLCALKNIQYCCQSVTILPENYSGPPLIQSGPKVDIQ